MKHILKLFFLFTVLIGASSCEKDENKIYYEGGTAPVLTASSTAPQVLVRTNASKPAVTFNWTNPNYKFTTGVSSQDVTYILQVDSAGKNFSSPKMQEISISRDLSKNLTVGELNGIMSKMELAEDKPHTIDFRIKSTLVAGTAPLLSNTIKIVITPYLDVVVPIPTNNTLWITGDAAPSGWSNPLTGSNLTNQQFKIVPNTSNTIYELTLDMPGGGNYKLIQINGDWSSQYHMLPGGTWSSGEFEKKDSDPGFPGPPTAGTYKITVNFRTGKYTVVKI